MILTRISGFVDKALIKEKASLRPSRSCCGQVLNLAQYIEDGFKGGQVTGVAFLDLSAAYDTVNHKVLAQKEYNLTKNYTLTKFIGCML